MNEDFNTKCKISWQIRFLDQNKIQTQKQQHKKSNTNYCQSRELSAGPFEPKSRASPLHHRELVNRENLLVRNYLAQSFHIWLKTSSRGPLPTLFKLWYWCQNWPCPGGHRKLQTTSSPEPLMGIWPDSQEWSPVVPCQNCSNSSDWLHK